MLNVGDLVELVQDGKVAACCEVYRTTAVHAFILNKTIVIKLRRDYHVLLEEPMKLTRPGALLSNSTYWRAHESLRIDKPESNAVQLDLWKPCEESSPQEGQKVLCVNMLSTKKQITEATFQGGEFIFTNLFGNNALTCTPTHWMPAPKLPE